MEEEKDVVGDHGIFHINSPLPTNICGEKCPQPSDWTPLYILLGSRAVMEVWQSGMETLFNHLIPLLSFGMYIKGLILSHGAGEA